MVERTRSFFRRFRFGAGGVLGVGAVAAIAVMWAGTGFYQVSSEGGERAVFRPFGK